MRTPRDEPEPRVVLICSYPRSGSNWVGQVLRLVESARSGIDPERAGLFHDLEVVRTEVDVESYLWPARSPLIFFKTHELPSVVFGRGPGLRGEVRAAVNIVRHPLDVMVSAFRWSLLAGRVVHEGRVIKTIDESRSLGLLDAYVDSFLEHAGAPEFAASGYGSWREHTHAWGGGVAEGVPVVRARYRELVASPAETFAGLAEGIGMADARDLLAPALAACTPERVGRPLGEGFVHRAGDRTYEDTLSASQIERGLGVFGGDIERLGL